MVAIIPFLESYIFLTILTNIYNLKSFQMVAIFPFLDMYFCIATKWARHLGFLVTYSALLMKTWR